MTEELKIVYQHYIPDELISNFEKLGLDKQLKVDIKKEKEEQKYHNFTGSEISDIVIYIQQHTTELIVSGMLVNLAYDMLIGGIKLLWTELSKLAIKKLQSGSKEKDKRKSISVRLMDKERAIEIILDGDFATEEQASKIIDESFKFMSSPKLNETFNNPDFIPNEKAKPKIRLIYNMEKQVWEPENFGEYRRIMAEYEKWANENLSS